MRFFLLLFVFSGFSPLAVSAAGKKPVPFYIDIRGGLAFVRPGFDVAYTVINPAHTTEKEDTGVLRMDPGKRITNFDISQKRGKKRNFLFPAKSNVAENTIIIPFTIESSKYIRLDQMQDLPALYLAGIGDNWEVYLNGRLVGWETRPVRGKVTMNANYRQVTLPLEKRLLNEGENILSFRITGAEFDRKAGLLYSGPYLITEQNNIPSVYNDIFLLTAVSICLMLALLCLTQFLFNRLEIYYFFYALFNLFCGLFFITKLSLIHEIIPSAYWTSRAGFFFLFLIPSFFIFFVESFILESFNLESFTHGKIRRVSLVYFFISLFAAVIQLPLPMTLIPGLERFWMTGTALVLLYSLLYDLFIPFGKEIKAILEKNEKSRIPAVLLAFVKSPRGNFAFAILVFIASFLLDSMIAGFFPVETRFIETRFLKAGYLVFTVISACSLIHANSITVRKAKYAGSEHADYLNLILNNSPDMIVLFNSEQRITNCAAAFLNKLPGYTLNDLLNTDYRDIFKTFLKDDVLENLSIMFHEALTQKKTISIFESIDFSGNDMKHYEMHFTPMFGKDGSLEGSLLLLSDMTDMLAAVQKAEEANRAKTSFLATMSHEIRTPLNAILGLSEIQLLSQLPDKTRLDLEKIYLSGSNLLQIINDILDISKIETEKFVIETDNYNLVEVVNDCIQFNIIHISEKPIRFSLEINEEIPAHLWGDELRIKQIINNLLSNAFKYTKRGNVTLIINYEKIDDRNIMLLIHVKDTGIGIKEENIGILFGDYTRFDQNANKFIEGTGLGLSITKKLVEMMGGAIGVESEYGKGSSFRIKLPQGVTDDASIGEETADKLKSLHYFGKKQKKQVIRKNFTGKKLLVVDDVSMNIDVAKGLISLYGIEVHGVSSGKTAIELIRSSNIRYDIIVMDHMMPEMSGVEAVRIIRSQIDSDYARTVPIIAFTANAIPENTEIFFANGFNGYLTKPVDVYELDDVLNKFLVDDSGDIAGLEEIPAVPEAEEEITGVADAEFPMLDIETAIRNFGGINVFINILKKSIDNLPSMLEEIKYPKRETLKDYEIKIHGLKGAICGIYYEEGGKLAAELEQYANEGDIDAVLARNDAFIAVMTDFIETLREKLNTSGAKAETAEDVTLLDRPDKNLLLSLREAAEQYRTIEMEEIMHSLGKYRYRENNDILLWLHEKVEALEYHDIVTKLLSMEKTYD
jgi:PAS domain S-box-containing protein